MPAWLERPWYPFVAAIYPLWFLYMTNLGQVRVTAVLATSLVAMAIVAGLLWIAARLAKSRTVGALGFSDLCADLERQVEPGAIGQARTVAARLRGLLPRLERHILAELGARQQDHQV